MANHLETFINKKVIQIGRIAGQYCKPRSNNYEIINKQRVKTYRGDMMNSYNDPCKRESDINLLQTAY